MSQSDRLTFCWQSVEVLTTKVSDQSKSVQPRLYSLFLRLWLKLSCFQASDELNLPYFQSIPWFTCCFDLFHSQRRAFFRLSKSRKSLYTFGFFTKTFWWLCVLKVELPSDQFTECFDPNSLQHWWWNRKGCLFVWNCFFDDKVTDIEQV